MSLLSEIYHIAKGSISRRKMRLKEKMHIENSSFDEFYHRILSVMYIIKIINYLIPNRLNFICVHQIFP
mgnify:CR=1 FL=1